MKAELNSDKKDRKKEAVKKVIASMTVGKDVRYIFHVFVCLDVGYWKSTCAHTIIIVLLFCVSLLFPDVVNCMQTDNLELKKLVYLYLMNYAKTQPDMAIMAVNTFVKVCSATALYTLIFTLNCCGLLYN